MYAPAIAPTNAPPSIIATCCHMILPIIAFGGYQVLNKFLPQKRCRLSNVAIFRAFGQSSQAVLIVLRCAQRRHLFGHWMRSCDGFGCNEPPVFAGYDHQPGSVHSLRTRVFAYACMTCVC